MSREGWIAAGVAGALGWLWWRGSSRKTPTSSDPKLSQLVPEARGPVSELLARLPGARIVSARRTCAEQRALYAQGRTAPGPVVTGANGCSSWHVLGRAVDLSAPGATRATWEKLGIWWEARGGHWGGRFKNVDDPAHFEWHPGLRISDLCPDPERCEELVVT
jgi:hypothetical protein